MTYIIRYMLVRYCVYELSVRVLLDLFREINFFYCVKLTIFVETLQIQQ